MWFVDTHLISFGLPSKGTVSFKPPNKIGNISNRITKTKKSLSVTHVNGICCMALTAPRQA
jgi:filamentous hemagglutinin family protein